MMARLILDVNRKAWRQLERFARRQGWDSAEFVRRAIGTEQYLIEQEEAGYTVELHSVNRQAIVKLRIGALQTASSGVGPQQAAAPPDEPGYPGPALS